MSERMMMTQKSIGRELAEQIIYSHRELQDNGDRVGDMEKWVLQLKWEADVLRYCEDTLKHADAVIAEYHRMSVEHDMRSPAPWLVVKPKDPA